MRSSTDTLIAALRILSGDIHCEDRVATAAIAEAADRLREQDDEIARLRLTDAEREAVETATAGGIGHEYARRAATLRGLLERLK